jgi:hypothetical protein
MFATVIFESIYSDVADQNAQPMPLHLRKEITHYHEINDKTFNISYECEYVGYWKKCNPADFIPSIPWTK